MKSDLNEFIDGIEDATKKKDCLTLLNILEEESGYKPVLRGQIIGFGMYHYKYDSGREGDWIVTGFSPRAQNISIYIIPGFSEYKNELALLGKHKTAKSCLYIKKLADIDESILRSMVRNSVEVMKTNYECRDS